MTVVASQRSLFQGERQTRRARRACLSPHRVKSPRRPTPGCHAGDIRRIYAPQRDGQGNVTTSGYDPAGRPLQVTDPVSGTTQYQDDPAGNTMVITAGSSGGVVQIETRAYDSWNRVLTDTVSGPNTTARQTLTAYDADGNVVQTQQPNGDVALTLYDCAYNCTDQPKEIDLAPASGAATTTYQSFIYDAAGQVKDSADADNREHLITCDEDSRMVQQVDRTYLVTGTESITTTSGYDPDGNPLTQTVQSRQPDGMLETHTQTTSYNAADWPLSVTNDSLTTSYGYDAAGQERTHTLLQSDSTPLTTVLDPQGRATAIGETVGGTGPYTTSFAYNQNDLPLALTMPGGVQEGGAVRWG